ncbi:hypothetical protein AAMO2058_000065500 [Amorphochlora amoebiformis]
MVMHRSGRSAPPLAAIIVAGALAFLAFIAFIPPAQPDQKLGTVMARRMPVARMCEHRAVGIQRRREKLNSIIRPRVDINQLDFSDPQVQAISAAVGAAIAGLGLLLARGQDSEGSSATGRPVASPMGSIRRGVRAGTKISDAIGVFGATGNTGREVVEQLLADGQKVVGYVRDPAKAKKTFADLKAGPALSFRQSDVTLSDTVTPALFDGIKQLVVALGPVYGKNAETGEFGPVDGMTPEAVDYKGVSNVINSAKGVLPASKETVTPIFDFGWTPESAVDSWSSLDDVIMGGTSSSEVNFVGGNLRWSGTVVSEGGGFCGMRTAMEEKPLMLADADGIKLRVKGDGNRYKFTIGLKSTDTKYQHPFNTQKGFMEEIYLPFEAFVGLSTENKNFANYSAIPLSEIDRSQVDSMNIVISKFEFNGMPNPNGIPTDFELRVDSISKVAKPKPQIVLITSAAVERNARIETKEERENEIPIVKLNPNGILNWKYKGENVLRESGLEYAVIRPTGLTTQNMTTDYALDLKQGDSMSGSISRKEIAALTSLCLTSSCSTGKTMELRRSESRDALGVPGTNRKVLLGQLQGLVRDSDRFTAGLPVLPRAVDPPVEPLTEKEKEEVLNDPRVKAQREREPGSQQVAGRAIPSFVVYRNGKPLAPGSSPSGGEPAFVVYRDGKPVTGIPPPLG